MKIWSKLFLVAATGMMMFSSCLENIEPEGIADLRGAKAELLRAETALVEAKAARENAEAAIALAKAKVEEAIAKQEEAKAAYEAAVARLWELEAEKKEAMNAIELEQAMAEAKAAIALAEKQAAVYAAELERALQQIQTDVVKAQIEYEKALKNLAVAKVALTKKQENYLKPFVLAVTTAEGNVETATVTFETASEALANALKFVEDNKKYAVRWGEKEVAKAEAALEGALEAVEIAEAALKIDSTVVDWVEMRAELEAEKKAVEDKGMAAYVDGEYAELKATLYGVYAEAEEGGEPALEEEGLIHKAEAYTYYTGMTFDEETGKFVEPVFPVTTDDLTAMEYPAVYVAAPVDAEGNPVGEDFTLNEYTEDTPSTTAGGEDDTPKMYYGDASAVLAVFDDAIEDFEKLTSTKYYDYMKMVYEAELKGIEEYEDNVAAFEEYESAIAAYKAGDPTQYYKAADEDYDIETPVAEYNAALKAMVDALNTYNTEYKKYEAADNSEAEDAARKLYDDAKAKAFATYVGKRQTALDEYNKAKVAYDKADLAHKRAKRSYDADLNAAVTAVGAIEGEYKVETDVENVAAVLTGKVKEYNDAKAGFVATEETPKFDADGKWTAAVAIYTAELAKVNNAQKLYNDTADLTNKTDALSVWEAAQDAYAKAGGSEYQTNTGGDYYKAVTAAWNEYVAVAGDGAENGVEGTEVGSAWQTYQDTLEDLGVGATGMDTEYKGYLWKNYTDAVDALIEAIGDLVANDAIKTGEDVEVVMGDEDYLSFKYVENEELVDPKFPDYLVDEKTQALKEIKVADVVVDKEYFLATTVKELADNLAAFAKFAYEVDGEDYDLYVVAGKPADYPASLPTYEAIIEEIAAIGGGSTAIEQYATEVAIRELAETGVFVDAQNATIDFVNSPLVQGGNIKYQMAQNEAARANTAVAADHIKVLEAAKAEFEAYVVEAEKAVDAIRTEVEAAWAEVYPKYAELEEARETAMARYAEVKATITRITNAINLYINNNFPTGDEGEGDDEGDDEAATTSEPDSKTMDELVAALQKVYDDAVDAADKAEFKLDKAKERLEKINNDELGWIEALQEEFDEAKAELEEAMAELAEAAAALEAAMKAVGADQVPVAPGSLETPETPETSGE